MLLGDGILNNLSSIVVKFNEYKSSEFSLTVFSLMVAEINNVYLDTSDANFKQILSEFNFLNDLIKFTKFNDDKNLSQNCIFLNSGDKFIKFCDENKGLEVSQISPSSFVLLKKRSHLNKNFQIEKNHFSFVHMKLRDFIKITKNIIMTVLYVLKGAFDV